VKFKLLLVLLYFIQIQILLISVRIVPGCSLSTLTYGIFCYTFRTVDEVWQARERMTSCGYFIKIGLATLRRADRKNQKKGVEAANRDTPPSLEV
jgi:hypothetical protein